MATIDSAAVAEAVAFGIPQQLDPELFRALAHPTRCVLLELLAKKSSRPTELAKQLANVFGLWHHLSQLSNVDIIKARRVTRKRTVYSVNVAVLRNMAQQLATLAEQAATLQAKDSGEEDDALRHELEEALEA